MRINLKLLKYVARTKFLNHFLNFGCNAKNSLNHFFDLFITNMLEHLKLSYFKLDKVYTLLEYQLNQFIVSLREKKKLLLKINELC